MNQQTEFAEPDGTGFPENASGMHRRSFLTGTATGFVGGGAVAVGAFAFRSSDVVPQQTTDDVEKQMEASTSPNPNEAEVDRIVSNIQSRYSTANFNDRTLVRIREQVAAQLVRSRVLGDFNFDGSDRPANLFVPAEYSLPQSERE